MAAGVALLAGAASATTAGAGADTRLTNDNGAAGGYRYTGGDTTSGGVPIAYTDEVLTACSADRERQNEPSVEADPRNASLLLGSSNDYCPVQAPSLANQNIWLGYYRSQNGGSSWQSGLVPGYPGDTSPASTRAQVNAASSGDPVIAWDTHGNAYFGAEASGVAGDPFSKKTNGDIWVGRYKNPDGDNGNPAKDASYFAYSRTVANGSQAPNLLGVFNDKTSIEVDRTGGACDGNVYFAYSRFNGNGVPGIFFTRSTDRGNSWTTPHVISNTLKDVQFPDIAVTSDGTVTVTWRQIESKRAGQTDAVVYNVSKDCGQTFFNQPLTLANFIHYDEQDVSGGSSGTPVDSGVRGETGTPDAGSGHARDCGDGRDACKSGYTFFRQDSQVRSTADEKDTTNTVYVVYNATKPGTETATGTTYGTIVSGTGSQSAIYFTTITNGVGRGDGSVVDDQAKGHQFFPDVAASGGKLHLIWWDSRNDAAYSRTLPPGNTATRTNSGDALDVYATAKKYTDAAFPKATRVTNRGTNGNWEQFDGRRVPFAGDYLWVTAVGEHAYVVWTDARDTVAGTDPRAFEASETVPDGFDVMQCRLASENYAVDHCQDAGGKDQNIYGNSAP
jgi:hypothetical protein